MPCSEPCEGRSSGTHKASTKQQGTWELHRQGSGDRFSFSDLGLIVSPDDGVEKRRVCGQGVYLKCVR